MDRSCIWYSVIQVVLTWKTIVLRFQTLMRCMKQKLKTIFFFRSEIEDVDVGLDMSSPMRGAPSPPTPRSSSPLPPPEVVRYNTSPRGVVTIRGGGDVIPHPHTLSRTGNNQLFYS